MQLEGVIVSGRGLDSQWLPLENGMITLLFGRNGSGKTAALESVAWAAGAISDLHEEQVARLRDEPFVGPLFHGSGGFTRAIGGALIVRLGDEIVDRAFLARLLSPEALDLDDVNAADGVDLMQEEYVRSLLEYSEYEESSHDARTLARCLSSTHLVALGAMSSLAVSPWSISDADRGAAVRLALAVPEATDERLPVGSVAALLARGRPAWDEDFRVLQNMTQSLERKIEVLVRRTRVPLDPVAVPVVLDRRLRVGERLLSEELEEGIARLCRRILGVQHAAQSEDLAAVIVDELERRANDLAPRFVLEVGELRARSVRYTGLWQRDRLLLGVASGDEGHLMPLELVGAGVAGWAAATLRIAMSELEAADWGVDGPDGEFLAFEHWPGLGGRGSIAKLTIIQELVAQGLRADDLRAAVANEPGLVRYRTPVPMPYIYLIDEPEQHLHLGALRDVNTMLLRLADTGAAVCVATHAPALLDLPDGRAHVVLTSPGIAREASLDGSDEIVHATVPDHTLEVAVGPALSELRMRAEELGIEPSSLIQFMRGFLFVEGMNDQWLLQHFFGPQLAEAHVDALALHGGSRAPGLAELELLWSLGKPIVVMLDNIRTDVLSDLRKGRRGSRPLSYEEQWLASLATAMRGKDARFHLVGIEAPDIVCAIPGAAIRDALTTLGANADSFVGWKPFREVRSTDFKKNFESVTAVSVDRVLRHLRQSGFDGPPSRDLVTAFSDAMEFLRNDR
jgi:energy-coupling factor transporter ATP-binding protein EcfA2